MAREIIKIIKFIILLISLCLFILISVGCVDLRCKVSDENNLKRCDSYKYVVHSKPCEYKEKLNNCQKECEKGNLKACANLSYIYTFGKGVNSNYQKAYELANKTCKNGIAFGCYNLGILYQYKVENREIKKAMKYLNKACEMGNALGCYRLGIMYEYGENIKRDTNLAYKYLLKACNLGKNLACEKLKSMKKVNNKRN